jgi:hypothetical protein
LINTKATSSAPDLKFDFKAMSLKEASLNITWRFDGAAMRRLNCLHRFALID